MTFIYGRSPTRTAARSARAAQMGVRNHHLVGVNGVRRKAAVSPRSFISNAAITILSAPVPHVYMCWLGASCCALPLAPAPSSLTEPQRFPGKCHVCLPASGSGLCAPSCDSPS